jgi:hypothetical protein
MVYQLPALYFYQKEIFCFGDQVDVGDFGGLFGGAPEDISRLGFLTILGSEMAFFM